MSNIIGLPRWNDPDAYYSQVNNAVEAMLRKSGVSQPLESCGPTSAVCILDALGANIDIMTPGGANIQPEDALTCWMNDPANHTALKVFRDNVDPVTFMCNQVPQWYMASIPAVFGVKAQFNWGAGIDELSKALKAGRGVMLTLVKPGHYIAIVAQDLDSGEFIYHDPWPDNYWPAYNKGKPGFARRVRYADLMANIKAYRVEVGN